MKYFSETSNDTEFKGLKGLPEYYPVPYDQQDMLFYIQRNQNRNTIIYQLNKNLDGFINIDKPVNVYWKEFERNGVISEINFLQEKLAYGYRFNTINNETLQLSIVSYPSYMIYLTKIDGKYKAISKFNDHWAQLTNIYVYAEDFGVFPDVKYIELYGMITETGLPCYEKINISE